MEKKEPSDDVSIGKFEILATYTYARPSSTGWMMTRRSSGAWWRRSWRRGRLGVRKEDHEDFQAQKEAAEKKKKTTITAESFDNRSPTRWAGFSTNVPSEYEEAGRGGAVLR